MKRNVFPRSFPHLCRLFYRGISSIGRARHLSRFAFGKKKTFAEGEKKTRMRGLVFQRKNLKYSEYERPERRSPKPTKRLAFVLKRIGSAFSRSPSLSRLLS